MHIAHGILRVQCILHISILVLYTGIQQIHAYIHTYIHTYIYKYIHTYIHTAVHKSNVL